MKMKWNAATAYIDKYEMMDYYNSVMKNREEYIKERNHLLMSIKNIDFQPPLTVVIWEDGTKTFVKCTEGEVFDPEKGAAMAIAKKALGDNYNYIEKISYYVDKWLKKDCSKKYTENKCECNFTDTEKDIINKIRICDAYSNGATSDFIFELLADACEDI